MDSPYRGESLATLRKQFSSYASAKTEEIREAREARRYYSGVQWSPESLAVLRRRGQPAITFNRVTRKVNGLIGTIRRLRTDPKASPRNPGDDEAAELATQVVRYVCDANRFEMIEGLCSLDAAMTGIGVAEMILNDSGQGDYDIELRKVDPRTFFYDPRSLEADFSDARYMGTYRWADKDELTDIAGPDAEKLGEGDGGEFSTEAEQDTEDNWQDAKGRVKLVDHWYLKDGKWHWCLFAGSTKLREGESPFLDDKGKTICKFFAVSQAVDQDGDRYGLIRDLKGPQDAINQHRSKAAHIMNTRQIIAREGALSDIEATRKEAARPDGVILYRGERGEFEITQPDQEFLQQTNYFQDAKAEIENFGPNPALVGTGVQAKSGRAMAMMMQSGLSELGPFLLSLRAWKLSIYRAVWSTTKRYWTAQRWLRVTDNAKAAQFVEVNRLTIDEMGQPVIVNQLGAIDVDMILDEGPDTETVTGDVYDTLQSLANNGVPVPPQAIIEVSNLPASTKEKVLALLSQPDPGAEQAKALALESEKAKVDKTRADTRKTSADAARTEFEIAGNAAMMGAMMQPAAPQGLPF